MDNSSESIFEIIQEATREDNFEVQLEIIKHLSQIGAHLGPERTREELLPFIKENLDLHDEFLFNISEQLGHFIPLVGGLEHAQVVLDVLVKLCKTDEPIVRDRAIESLKTIAEEMNNEQIQTMFLPILDGMAADNWFTSKCSAAILHPVIYSKVNEDQKTNLRNSFRTLIQDDSLIVRKTAATALVDLITLLETESIKNEFLPIFDNISKDCSDSVKVFYLDVAIALSKRLAEAEFDENIIKSIESWADDPSWRIRQKLAQHISEIQATIPYNRFRGNILALYQKLCKDFESEVRVIAAKNLFRYSESLQKSYEIHSQKENFKPVFQQSILPQIKLLTNDLVEDVRLAVATNLLHFSSLLDKDSFKNDILPLITEILENETCMAIQESILHSLNQLPETIDLTQSLLSIKNVVRTLIINSQSHWRTRRNLLVAFTHIARFASKEFFSENLKVNYAALLGDPVFAVRRSAALILPLLAKQYSIHWTLENIIPFFTMFTKDCRYLYRYVPLFGIQELIKSSLNQQDKYLNDFQMLVQHANTQISRKAIRAVVKIFKLKNKVKEMLEEQKCRDILSLTKNISDFEANDKIDIYAEDILDTLKSCSDCNIFSIEETSLVNNTYTYLEGILILIHRKFLNVIMDLFDDVIINIQIRSLYMLNEIKEFIDRLEKELQQSWVQQILTELSNEELENISNEINLVLSEEVFKNEEHAEEVESVKTIINLEKDSNIVKVNENIEEHLEEVKLKDELREDGGSNRETNKTICGGTNKS